MLKRQVIMDVDLLLRFSWDDFKAKYAGSVGGVLWAFLQPMTTILLYWFVFQIVFGNDAVNGMPFILWLISGLVPWFFLSDSISSSVPSMVEYSYLIKKVRFNIRILPLVKPMSSMCVHAFLIVFAVIAFCLYGIYPDIYFLQLPLYAVYMFIVVSGFSYLLSTLFVFFRDISQLVAIFLQVVFWTTPIVWNLDTISVSFVRWIIPLTPFYYIISGYRNIFVNKVWFWEQDGLGLYYWVLATAILLVGISLYKKCKKHFADVL